MLRFHASFSAQRDVESCASHLHHSLQLVPPHQVVTLEGLVVAKEMKHLMYVLSVCTYNEKCTIIIISDLMSWKSKILAGFSSTFKLIPENCVSYMLQPAENTPLH